MMRTLRALMVAPVFAVLAACGSDDPTAPAGPNVVEVAQAVNAETGEFSTLIAAVLAADLAEELSGPGQRTVFAPTDAAFTELGLNAQNIGDVPVATLTEILLYHIASGRLAASAVLAVDQLQMANGGVADVRMEGDGAYINEARIVTTDVEASNGIIHVIDAVLIP